ncbi:hypothetical protein Cgig2_033491 [Carnegiea gigantea]|uniref:Uncharacterized protein n=1 Tax=Carnegiea gigantea TaxID=171969 RepID=A0A9Q1GU19_9CARY|nr:hypothetical protein Cgig2_033491 [Carnegiea gigantea]
MHSRNSPNIPKNTAQESSEKTITDIHQQPSEETDDTMEDTTYKRPSLGHNDESESDHEVLGQPEKKEDVRKSLKPPLSVIKHEKEQKSLKKKKDVQKSAIVPVEGPKSMQYVPKPAEEDTKSKKIFQTRMSPSEFVGMINNFNDAQRKAIQDMGFDPYSITFYISPDKRIEITPMDVHLTSALSIGGRKVDDFYEKKPKDAKYNEVLDAWKKD